MYASMCGCCSFHLFTCVSLCFTLACMLLYLCKTCTVHRFGKILLILSLLHNSSICHTKFKNNNEKCLWSTLKCLFGVSDKLPEKIQTKGISSMSVMTAVFTDIHASVMINTCPPHWCQIIGFI